MAVDASAAESRPAAAHDLLVGPIEADKPSALRTVVEWVLIIGVALLAAVVLKAFLVQAFFIPSQSMEPTLDIGDRVLVNKLSYKLHEVHRGDLVVFKRPPGPGPDPEIKDLIKRVVGLPGDTIESRDGAMWVNGSRLNESYLAPGAVTSPPVAPLVVPAGHYWVMGDNRQNSRDSRYFGAIPESLIVGRAFIRVWPPTGLHLL